MRYEIKQLSGMRGQPKIRSIRSKFGMFMIKMIINWCG